MDQISEASLARLLRKKSIHYTVLHATCDSLLENSKITDEPCASISAVTTDTTDNLPPELAEEFKEIFKEPSKFSKKPIEHVIELQPHTKAHHARPYRLTPKETKELRLLIDDLLKKFIDPSTSPFASPVLLVRKPDGTYRLVIDYRILNSHTIKECQKLKHCSTFIVYNDAHYHIPSVVILSNGNCWKYGAEWSALSVWLET